jgi:hypothetical protein
MFVAETRRGLERTERCSRRHLSDDAAIPSLMIVITCRLRMIASHNATTRPVRRIAKTIVLLNRCAIGLLKTKTIRNGETMNRNDELDYQDILQATKDRLMLLRNEALGLPHWNQVAPVLEAIEVNLAGLNGFTTVPELIEWGQRAVLDVRHEIAAVKYGWESAEACIAERAMEDFELEIRDFRTRKF